MKLVLSASALLLSSQLLLDGCSFEQSGAKADGKGTGTASATDVAAATGAQVTSGSSPQSPAARPCRDRARLRARRRW
jgi:hypothetical protein